VNAAQPALAGNGDPADLVRPEGMVASRLMIGREAMAWTLPEQIAVAVGDRILREEIAPGNRIGEEILAKQFQVSRGPIRDALKILEHVGLVAITSRRGAIATALTVDDRREIFELRENLFELAIRGFGRAITDDALAQLRRHVSALEAAASDQRLALLFSDAIDRAMLFLAHHCGNRRIAQILTTLSLQSFRYFGRSHMRGPDANARRIASLKFYRDLALAYEEGQSLEPLIIRLRQIYADRERYIGEYLP
jgi:DNA-binding GntR family transcriptional regulator